MKKHHGVLILFLWTCWLDQAFSAITCLDPDNKPVDWYYVYKLPRIKTPPSIFKEGTGMIYLDSKLPEWKILQQPITGKNHPIYYTVQQIYKMKDDIKSKERAYLMYNDQIPDKKASSSKAHAKGSLCFDKKSGFWLIHSVPAFPSESYFLYPDSGTVYGQTFVCVTYAATNLDSIGKQLQCMNPQLYNYNASANFATDAPKLWELLSGKNVRKKKMKVVSNVESLKSANGTRFVSFAKSKDFKKDLYLDMVAPHLKSNLLVGTWLNGNGDFPTNCTSQFTVKNALSMNVLGMKFKNSQDHSKWAISDYPDQDRSNLSGGVDDDEGDTQKGKYDDNDGDNDDDDDDEGDSEDSKDSELSELLNEIKSLNLANNYFGATKTNSRKGENETDWVCLGDINRQKSQATRGGGTLCLKDRKVWKQFRKLVSSIEDCDGKEKAL